MASKSALIQQKRRQTALPHYNHIQHVCSASVSQDGGDYPDTSQPSVQHSKYGSIASKADILKDKNPSGNSLLITSNRQSQKRKTTVAGSPQPQLITGASGKWDDLNSKQSNEATRQSSQKVIEKAKQTLVKEQKQEDSIAVVRDMFYNSNLKDQSQQHCKIEDEEERAQVTKEFNIPSDLEDEHDIEAMDLTEKIQFYQDHLKGKTTQNTALNSNFATTNQNSVLQSINNSHRKQFTGGKHNFDLIQTQCIDDVDESDSSSKRQATFRPYSQITNPQLQASKQEYGSVTSKQTMREKKDLLNLNVMRLEKLLWSTSQEHNPVANLKRLMRKENAVQKLQRERYEAEHQTSEQKIASLLNADPPKKKSRKNFFKEIPRTNYQSCRSHNPKNMRNTQDQQIANVINQFAEKKEQTLFSEVRCSRKGKSSTAGYQSPESMTRKEPIIRNSMGSPQVNNYSMIGAPQKHRGGPNSHQKYLRRGHDSSFVIEKHDVSPSFSYVNQSADKPNLTQGVKGMRQLTSQVTNSTHLFQSQQRGQSDMLGNDLHKNTANLLGSNSSVCITTSPSGVTLHQKNPHGSNIDLQQVSNKDYDSIDVGTGSIGTKTRRGSKRIHARKLSKQQKSTIQANRYNNNEFSVQSQKSNGLTQPTINQTRNTQNTIFHSPPILLVSKKVQSGSFCTTSKPRPITAAHSRPMTGKLQPRRHQKRLLSSSKPSSRNKKVGADSGTYQMSSGSKFMRKQSTDGQGGQPAQDANDMLINASQSAFQQLESLNNVHNTASSQKGLFFCPSSSALSNTHKIRPSSAFVYSATEKKRQPQYEESVSPRDSYGNSPSKGYAVSKFSKATFVPSPGRGAYQGKHNSQTEALRDFLKDELLNSLHSGDFTKSQYLVQQSKLFDQIYVKHKKINSSFIKVDKIVDQKMPCLSESQIDKLFEAKCADLTINKFSGQRERFKDVCSKLSTNRFCNFREMGIGINFAAELRLLLLSDYSYHIAHLDLGKNSLGDAGVEILAKAVKFNRSLVSLCVSSNDIGGVGMRQIFKDLTYNESLSSLDVCTEDGIKRNRMNQPANKQLGKFMMKNKFVQQLNLSGIGLGTEGFNEVLEGLMAGHKELQQKIEEQEQARKDELDKLINDNIHKADPNVSDYENQESNLALSLLLKVKEKHTKQIMPPSMERVATQVLDVSFNDISPQPENILEKFRSAVAYSDLRELNLQYNKLGNQGVRCIAHGLSVKSRLEKLNLTACEFKEKGFTSILIAMAKNTSLKHLVLDKNDCSKDVKHRFWKEMFLNNRALEYFSLSNCQINDEAFQSMARGLGQSTKLHTLIIANNNLLDQGAEYLSETFVYENFRIKNLDMSGNKIQDKAACKIAKMIGSNNSIQYLNLKNNDNLTDVVGRTFIQTIKTSQINRSLQKVNLSHNLVKIALQDEINKMCRKNKEEAEVPILKGELSNYRAKSQGAAVNKFGRITQFRTHAEELEAMQDAISVHQEKKATFEEHVIKIENELLQLQKIANPDLVHLRQVIEHQKDFIKSLEEEQQGIEAQLQEVQSEMRQDERILLKQIEKTHDETHVVVRELKEKQKALSRQTELHDNEVKEWMKQVEAEELNMRARAMVCEQREQDITATKAAMYNQRLKYEAEKELLMAAQKKREARKGKSKSRKKSGKKKKKKS